MIFRKKNLPLILLLFISVLFSFGSCDDSASAPQVEADEKGTDDEKRSLHGLWKGTIPETWVRSDYAYSKDNGDGYSADVIVKTWQQNWEGKWLYLAHNFKNGKGEKMYGDIIFFFDNKSSCTDGYYIYLNTLPLEDEDD